MYSPATNNMDGRRQPADRHPAGPQHVTFDILRLELPAHRGHHSRKIWNHADEMRIDPDVVQRLARNGIRVGIAGQSAWPAIQTVVKGVGGTISSTSLGAGPGMPVSLALGEVEESETVFLHDNRNALKGRTFQRGKKLLTFTGYAPPDLAAGIQVGLELEIRHEGGSLTWARAADGIQAVPMVERQVFSEVGASALVGPGEILLIGPNHDVENEFLLGGKYFETVREGRARDVVICMTARLEHGKGPES